MNTINLRKKYGLTQSGLADLFDIPLRTVQNWEYRDCMPVYVYMLIDMCLRARNENSILREQIVLLKKENFDLKKS